MFANTLDSLPLTAVLILTVGLVLIAIEVGYRLGRWRRAQQTGLAESEAQLSAMTGAHLALLAFIMAFSFSMAAGHYQERRALILADVNAIGTAFLRADLIQEPEGFEIMDALVEYAAVRAKVKGYEEATAMVARSEELQSHMWLQVETLTQREQSTVLHSLLIQSLNAVFDVHEQRLMAALKNRVPHSLWAVLTGLLVLSMLGIGYFSGAKGARNPIASTGLALSFSLVLMLIADLDRPVGGLLKSDQTPMHNLALKLAEQRSE